jgi:hypothetical protein
MRAVITVPISMATMVVPSVCSCRALSTPAYLWVVHEVPDAGGHGPEPPVEPLQLGLHLDDRLDVLLAELGLLALQHHRRHTHTLVSQGLIKESLKSGVMLMM